MSCLPSAGTSIATLHAFSVSPPDIRIAYVLVMPPFAERGRWGIESGSNLSTSLLVSVMRVNLSPLDHDGPVCQAEVFDFCPESDRSLKGLRQESGLTGADLQI